MSPYILYFSLVQGLLTIDLICDIFNDFFSIGRRGIRTLGPVIHL